MPSHLIQTLILTVILSTLSGCILPPLPKPNVPELPDCKPVTIIKEKNCPTVLCPAQKVITKTKVVTKKVEVEVPPIKGGPLDLPIIGELEMVKIEPSDLALEARVDTGAETSSIHAENIKLIERDEKRYVQFDLTDQEGNLHPVERRLKRRVLIKKHNKENERRFVVKLWVTLGNTRERIEFTLTDRDNFDYPVLLGRNFLTDIAIVDVSRKHLVQLNDSMNTVKESPTKQTESKAKTNDK